MEVIKRKNRTHYREKIYLENGKRISKVFLRATDAKSWKYKMEAKKRLGENLLDEKKQSILFRDYVLNWFYSVKSATICKKTQIEYLHIFNKHLFTECQNKMINEVTRKDADNLVQKLTEKNRNAKTINKILIIFKMIMKVAKRDKAIITNPLEDYNLLKEKENDFQFLSKIEILQLLRASHGTHIYPVILLAVNTGMRIGEILGLHWDRVDFELSLITVSRTYSRHGLKESTKTNAIRRVPMNPEIFELLKNMWLTQKSPQFVITNIKGEPVNPDHFSSRDFKSALNKAGIRHIRFHDLRHTFASQFMMNGGNIYDLRAILGHTDVTMTMRYAHLSHDHLKQASQKVRFSFDGEKSNSPQIAHAESGSLNLKVISGG